MHCVQLLCKPVKPGLYKFPGFGFLASEYMAL